MTTSQAHLAPSAKSTAEPSANRSRIVTCQIDLSVFNQLHPVFIAWNNLVESHPNTTPVELPDFLLQDVSNLHNDLPTQLVYSERNNCIEALVVLAPSRIRSRKYTVLTRRLELQTYRIAGSRVFGEPDDTVFEQILDAAVDLANASDADAINLEDLVVGSRVWSYFDRKLSPWAPAGIQPHHQIHFPVNATEYWDKFS